MVIINKKYLISRKNRFHLLFLFINLFIKANCWHDVTLYEMTSWNIKDDLPRNFQTLLDLTAVLQRNENVDAENKIAILSRYALLLTFIFNNLNLNMYGRIPYKLL